jgi:MltA-interacting protein MipA
MHRAGSSDRFRSPRDSGSIALIDFDGFRAGPVLKFRSARTASSYAELNGLGDVKFVVEPGGFAEYFPVDWFRARVEVRRGFGGEDGVTADFSADAIVPLLDRFNLSAGPRFTLQSTNATAPYFSVNAAQSLASGLPVFDAQGGPRGRCRRAVTLSIRSAMGGAFLRRIQPPAGRCGSEPACDPSWFTEPNERRYRGVLFIRRETAVTASELLSMQSFAALLLLGLLDACAAVDASPPKLASVKTIGVISAIGDEFTLTRARLTGLGNSAQGFSIESWGVDDLIVSRASSLLNRRFEIHPVTYRRGAFAALEGDSAVTAVNHLRTIRSKSLFPPRSHLRDSMPMRSSRRQNRHTAARVGRSRVSVLSTALRSSVHTPQSMRSAWSG